jgi:hypothetical protein
VVTGVQTCALPIYESGYVANAVYAAAAVESKMAQVEHGILWSASPSSKLAAETRANKQEVDTVDPDSAQGILNSHKVERLNKRITKYVESAYDISESWNDEKPWYELTSDPRCLTGRAKPVGNFSWDLEICLDVLFTFQGESSSYLSVSLTYRDKTPSAAAESLCKGIQIEGETFSLSLDGRSGCPPTLLIETGTLEDPEALLLSLAREDFVVQVDEPGSKAEYKFKKNEKLSERESFEKRVFARKALRDGLQHAFFK